MTFPFTFQMPMNAPMEVMSVTKMRLVQIRKALFRAFAIVVIVVMVPYAKVKINNHIRLSGLRYIVYHAFANKEALSKRSRTIFRNG